MPTGIALLPLVVVIGHTLDLAASRLADSLDRHDTAATLAALAVHLGSLLAIDTGVVDRSHDGLAHVLHDLADLVPTGTHLGHLVVGRNRTDVGGIHLDSDEATGAGTVGVTGVLQRSDVQTTRTGIGGVAVHSGTRHRSRGTHGVVDGPGVVVLEVIGHTLVCDEAAIAGDRMLATVEEGIQILHSDRIGIALDVRPQSDERTNVQTEIRHFQRTLAEQVGGALASDVHATVADIEQTAGVPLDPASRVEEREDVLGGRHAGRLEHVDQSREVGVGSGDGLGDGAEVDGNGTIGGQDERGLGGHERFLWDDVIMLAGFGAESTGSLLSLVFRG